MADGSYIREMIPDLCSTAFILECSERPGGVIGYFPETSPIANAYRGELLGLMAIYLILLAANNAWPSLQSGVKVYSDCLRALKKIVSLSPHRIPSRCRHSDILKNVMVNCSSLTFKVAYEHVRAQQDDDKEYDTLLRPSHVNCLCDVMTKGVVWGLAGEELPRQHMFPLELVAVFVGDVKLFSNMADNVRF